jgi:hypothetical protein
MCLYFMLTSSYIVNLRLVVYVALLVTFLSVFVIRVFTIILLFTESQVYKIMKFKNAHN